MLHRRSVLMLLITMVIWGSTFVVTKEVIAEFPPFALAFARVAIGALVLLPFAVMRHRRAAPGQQLPWVAIIALAFIGVALYYAAFNSSLLYTSASQGALVQSCIPAMTALVAVLWLGERASATRWLGISLSIVGVLIVFSGASSQDEASNTHSGAQSTLIGNLLMLATVVCWGVYTSLAKRIAAFDPVVVTASITGIGALMLLPVAVMEIAAQGSPQSSTTGWLSVFYLGAIASGAAYMFYNAALRHVDASEAGAYTNLIPIVGVATGIVVLDEPLSMRAIVGGIVVMTGVWITGKRVSTAYTG